MTDKINTLFITTSTKKMFDSNGDKLIKSFNKFIKLGNSKLLYCTENFSFPNDNKNILQEEISNYSFLTNWLEKYNKFIPPIFGGSYDKKKTPKIVIPTHSARYKSSLWFRKVVAIHFAFNKFKFNRLIWIDNDCLITGNITEDLILDLFKDQDSFICYGDFRKNSVVGVETGFFGVQNNYSLLIDLFDAYTSGDFMNTVNWGDGHVLAYIISKSNDKYKINDLGEGINEQHIMNFIPILKKFIVHNKGFYRKNDIDYNRNL